MGLAGERPPSEMTGLLQEEVRESREVSVPRRSTQVGHRGRSRSWQTYCATTGFTGVAVVALLLMLVPKLLLQGRRSMLTHVDTRETLEADSRLGGSHHDKCLDSYVLSDFSSKSTMELAGWSFNWDDEFTFKPPIYQMYAPHRAYWGCSKAGGGTISLTLQGQGVLTLDFGNSWGQETSSVTAFLNGDKEATAGPYTFSKTVKMRFKDGDTLDIVEGPSGVIVINSITFRCESTTSTSTTTTQPPPTTTSTSTKTTQTVTGKVTTTTEVPTTTTVTTSVTATTRAWKEIEEAKEKWSKEYEELQKKRLEERKKKEELEHQLELERHVLERIKAERKELEKATNDEKKALGQAKKETEKQRKRNEALKAAEKNRTGGERTKVEAGLNSSKQDHRLAKAVDRQQKQTEAELHDLTKERKETSEKEEHMAEHMEHELEKTETKKTKLKTNKRHEKEKKNAKILSLYCYSLMLPFGYEPKLLLSHQKKKVGIFACNDWGIFSNSTVLLDTKKPSPVKVNLLNFSLAVPYGGKWHTALNTGVFNKVWAEIVRRGEYLQHDWVVKADPDSVLFPDRLLELLVRREPMNRIKKQAKKTRRLHQDTLGRRLEWHAPANATCSVCRMPGFEGQSCTSHVQYIQKQGKSCSEALKRVAREPPTDCGCDCNRIEACDFKMDPKMYRNYQVIEGKAHPDAMYINNCKFGLHGPIEVLSQRAVTAYVEGLSRCNNLLVHPWGEDKFMDRCMLELGVTRVNEFGLLNEIACGETPAPCGDPDVAFHPFKSVHSYFACWEYANRYGHGPADPMEDARRNRSRQRTEDSVVVMASVSGRTAV